MHTITQALIAWYDAGHRDLPWRKTKDPYAIWVSEIMLQQTQVVTVIGYYRRFLDLFPTIQALAGAPEEQLLKAWEGLGYYSRARNLQRAAKQVVADHGGQMPGSYEALLQLPGIGPYTAGAIASIAFDQPVPAVDGNVQRVLSRVYAVGEDVASPKGKAAIQALAAQLVPQERPGALTNALMELGACVCARGNPDCGACPLQPFCAASGAGNPQAYPVKAKAKPQRMVQQGVALAICKGRVLICRRKMRLLGGLWVFPLLEDGQAPQALAAMLNLWGMEARHLADLGQARHAFTHLIWEMQIHAFQTDRAPEGEDWRWVTRAELEQVPMPTAVKVARAQAMALLMGDEPPCE